MVLKGVSEVQYHYRKVSSHTKTLATSEGQSERTKQSKFRVGNKTGFDKEDNPCENHVTTCFTY